MKKNLSTGMIAGIAGVVVIAIVVYGFIVMKPDFGPAPVVKPQPFQPPAGFQQGKGQSPGKPMGAPAPTK